MVSTVLSAGKVRGAFTEDGLEEEAPVVMLKLYNFLPQ